MSAHRYVLADVFTERPLAGNQLAVFMDAPNIDSRLLQPIAREMNLSETVFVFPPESGGSARVRYFTTSEELPFAGHPTLGTAAILANERFSNDESIDLELETPKMKVPVRLTRARDGEALFQGWMTQPIPLVQAFERSSELLALLGVSEPVLPVEVYDNGIAHLYVMLETREEVLALQPDITALGRVANGARINVFSGSSDTYTTRMFSPFDIGMPEDPATGSAAGPLATHLLRHGMVDSGAEITISQGERVGRPSTLRAIVEGQQNDIESVRVGGSVVLVGEGVLTI